MYLAKRQIQNGLVPTLNVLDECSSPKWCNVSDEASNPKMMINSVNLDFVAAEASEYGYQG